MLQHTLARLVRVSVLLIIACVSAPGPVLAQDVALKDAVQCKDFKHNRDGSWYADATSLDYGPGKTKQMNLFGATIKKSSAQAGEPDLWTLLNEECGAAAH